MKWKRMEWPLLVDSLNLFRVTAVPITLLIDELGVIRKIGPNDEDVRSFIEDETSVSAQAEKSGSSIPDLDRLREKAKTGTVSALKEFAESVFLWGRNEDLDETIDAYRKAVSVEPNDGLTHFRLGVALRKRYDSARRVQGDFAGAVEHWGKALEIDPNQYIWRRRIQQYGPRLDKPYPFYDWVVGAREDIRSRGEEPPSLLVEPGGAEIASPSRNFEHARSGVAEPDPMGRITRDKEGFTQVENTIVPDRMTAGQSVRVHVVFRTNEAIKAHWNNEAEDMVLWIDPPDGWTVNERYQTFPNPRETVENAPRRIEFELKSPKDAPSGQVTIPCYALYYACEDVNGVCVYRRQDISVKVDVK